MLMVVGLHANAKLKRSTNKPKLGIVHLGPGAFFRAFNAVYTHEVMQQESSDWGIVAISLRSRTALEQLKPQDGLYTSMTLRPEGNSFAQISSIVDVMVAPDDPGAAVNAMVNPEIKIVSLTITEKGYCHQPSTGRLNELNPDIQHDIANAATPTTAVGFIVEALRLRRDLGHAAFTVLSCDNLPSNGKVAQAVVLDYAKLIDEDLAQWISAKVSFPSTMVDRITPATTEDDIARVEQACGYRDPACVVHEYFRQWVIEDNFVAGRPDWDKAGAQFVRSVDAHENMKLRCLNGVHSALAYLGYLAGYQTISETVADPIFASTCEKLWREEIIPTVAQPEGVDLNVYCAELLERFKNPSIQHRTWQIAMDGSQKLPQRILATLLDNFNSGKQTDGLCLAVAAWMRYVCGVDEQGDSIDVRDPLAAEFKQATDAVNGGEQKVEALLGFKEIFPPALLDTPAFKKAVLLAYDNLETRGIRETIKSYIDS